MESIKVIQMLAAGGDLATIAVAFALFKLHTRLIKLETKVDLAATATK